MKVNVSIGVIGEVFFDAISNRTKAFLTVVCFSVAEVEQTIRAALGQTILGDRATIRVITSGVSRSELLRSGFSHLGCQFACEAILPISTGDNYIVYYGWNRALVGNDRQLARITPAKQLAAQAELLEQVMARPKKVHTFSGNVTVEVCAGSDNWPDSDIARLLEIYTSTFSAYLVAFSKETIREMLANNETALVRVDGVIAAVSMAEIATLDYGGADLVIAEISEVATHPDFQRQGLSYLATRNLLQTLEDKKVDVVFSEVRAASFGMMAVAWDCGLVPCGLLQKHCIIASPFSEVGQADNYGDLAVFGLPPRA